ncbi:MAG: tail fiber domain-containing protein [Patescibacteria group bacterium]
MSKKIQVFLVFTLLLFFTFNTAQASTVTATTTFSTTTVFAGNVGIGVTNPTSPLHVVGNMYLTGTIESAATNFSLYAAWSNAGSIRFLAGNNGTTWYERMKIMSSGNVGIGTSAPGALLHLSSSTPTLLIRPTDPLNDAMIDLNWAGIVSSLRLRYNPNSAMSYIETTYTPTVGTVYGDIAFRTNALGTPKNLLYLANYSANVGIGTTNPLGKLDIIESGNQIRIDADGSGTNYGGYPLTLNRTGSSADGILMHGAYVDNATYYWGQTHGSFGARGINLSYGAGISFYADNVATTLNTSFTPTERMRITNAGNVGIGTTTPTAELEMGSGSGYSIKAGNQKIGDVANPGADSDVVTLGWLNSAIAPLNPGGSNSLWSGTSTGNIWNTNSGNVGIGTTNPTAKLSIGDGINSLPASTTLWIKGVSGTGRTNRISLGLNNNQDYGIYIAENNVDYSSGQIAEFGTRYGGTDYPALYLRSGNVGIGTSSPSYLLTVGNNNQFTVGSTGSVQASGYQCNGGSCSYSWGGDTNIYRDAAAYILGLRYGTNPMTFRIYNTYTDASNYERLAIAGAAAGAYTITSQAAGTGVVRNIALMGGNVGVGTTTPQRTLQVNAADIPLGGGAAMQYGGNLLIMSNDSAAIDKGGSIGFGGNYSGTSPWTFASIKGARENVTSGTGYLAFFTELNGFHNEQMRINSSGNIGIGTTTPAARLEVVDNAVVSYSILADDKRIGNVSLPSLASDAATKGYVDSAIPLTASLWNGTTTGNIWNANSGNVGIGKTNPAKKLEVFGDIALSNGGKIGQGNGWGTDGNSYNATLELYNGATGYTTLQSATSYGLLLNPAGGNVGIGTTTPANKLQVMGDIDIRSGGLKMFNGSYGLSAVDGTLLKINQGGFNNTAFITGNVGIGTTTPLNKLHISGGVSGGTPYEATGGLTIERSARVSMQFLSPNTTDQYIFFGDPQAANRAWVGYNHATDQLLLHTGGTTYMDGNVGIGTSTPGYKLDVTGSINSGGIGVNGSLYLNSAADGLGGGSLVYSNVSNTLTLGQNRGVASKLLLSAAGIELQTEDSSSPYNKVTRIIVKHGDSGLVGIGTTTLANAKLTIVPNGQTYAIDAGNYKIGNVAAPSASADVVTLAYLQSYGNASSSELWSGTKDGAIWNGAAGAGNVGIGTTNPLAKLHIYGASNIEERIQATSSPYGAKLNLYYSDNSGGSMLYTAADAHLWIDNYYQASNEAAGYGDIQFRTKTLGGTTLTNNMVIKGYSGNIGIGTSTPSDVLHIYKSGVATDYVANSIAEGVNLRISNPGNNWGGVAGLIFENSGAVAGTGYAKIGATINDTSDSDLFFQISNAGTIAEGMRVASTGNVGIGTTAPGSILSILKSSTYNNENSGGIEIATGVANTNAKLILGAVADSYSYIQSMQQDWDWTSRPLVLMPNGGNVGIGTTTPTQNLTVGSAGSAGNATYNIGANRMAVNSSFYSYDYICAGNDSGACDTTNGVVIRGGNTPNTSANVSLSRGISFFNGGNVGIGTTNPTQKLEVVGSGYSILAGNQKIGNVAVPSVAADVVTLGYLQSYVNASSSDLWSGTKDGNIWNGTAGAGKVGVGITSPSANFHVASPMVTDSANNVVEIGENYTNMNHSILRLQGSAMTSNGYFLAAQDGNSGLYKFVVRGDGNVAIGTSSPSALLDVFGAPGKAVLSSAAGLTPAAGTILGTLGFRNTQYSTDSAYIHAITENVWAGADYPTALAFFTTTDGAISSSEKVRINNAGSVGIGTTNPGTNLHVVGTGRFSDYLYFGSSSVQSYMYHNNSDLTLRIGGDDDIAFFVDGQTTPKAIIKSSGNVGIGTTSPAFKLDVNGLARFNGNYLRIQNSSASNSGYIDFGNADAYVGYQTAGTFNIKHWDGTDYYESLRINGPSHFTLLSPIEGNVGIGITSPAAKLEVVGTGYSILAGSQKIGNVAVPSAAADVVTLGYLQSYVNASSSDLWSGTKDGNIWNGAAGAGKVGIGITSPSANFHVASPMVTDSANNVVEIGENYTNMNHSILRLQGSAMTSNGYFLAAQDGNSGLYRFVVRGDGAVGVGTSTPATELVVVGTGTLTGSLIAGGGSSSNWATLNAGGTQSINANGSIYSYNSVCVGNASGLCNGAGGVVIGLTNATASTNIPSSGNTIFNNGGNVGIGTTAPSYFLDVSKSQNAGTSFRVANANTGTGSFSNFMLTNNGANALYTFMFGTNYSSATTRYMADSGVVDSQGSNGLNLAASNAAGVIRFYTNANNERMRIAANGNIGIGTTNPNFDSENLALDAKAYISYIGTSETSTSIAPGVVIHNSGNVSGPTTLVLAKSRSTAEGLINANDEIGGIAFASADGGEFLGGASIVAVNDGTAANDDAGAHLDFRTSVSYNAMAAANTKMRITSGGNVGIGTTNPVYKLEVIGSIGASTGVYTNTFGGYSDRSLKKNITSLNNSLAKILKLRGVSFNWKSDNKDGIGLIAQEVEKVYPELVATAPNGLKAIQYSNLVAPLIEAVKAQQEKINQLEVKINILEHRLK